MQTMQKSLLVKKHLENVNLDGITHIRGAMAAFTGTTDRNAFDFTTSKEHNSDDPGINYMSNYTFSEGNFGYTESLMQSGDFHN